MSKTRRPDWATLGSLIKTRREELDLSIKDAAHRADVSQSTWTNIEKARNLNPENSSLRRVAITLGLPLARVFELAGREFQESGVGGDELDIAPYPEARQDFVELLDGVPNFSVKARRTLVDLFDLLAHR